jgi:hypothetical protein
MNAVLVEVSKCYGQLAIILASVMGKLNPYASDDPMCRQAQGAMAGDSIASTVHQVHCPAILLRRTVFPSGVFFQTLPLLTCAASLRWQPPPCHRDGQ